MPTSGPGLPQRTVVASNPFDEEPQAEYCWCVRSRDGKLVKFDNKSVLQARVKGYQTAALFPAVREAFACIPNGSRVHVFSNVKFFTDILNEEPSGRVKSGYLRTNKEPLAHQEEWRALDTHQSRTVSASERRAAAQMGSRGIVGMADRLHVQGRCRGRRIGGGSQYRDTI